MLLSLIATTLKLAGSHPHTVTDWQTWLTPQHSTGNRHASVPVHRHGSQPNSYISSFTKMLAGIPVGYLKTNCTDVEAVRRDEGLQLGVGWQWSFRWTIRQHESNLLASTLRGNPSSTTLFMASKFGLEMWHISNTSKPSRSGVIAKGGNLGTNLP